MARSGFHGWHFSNGRWVSCSSSSCWITGFEPFWTWAYGLPALVSDIPANKDVDLPHERYFKCGDVADLRKNLESLLERDLTENEKRDLRLQIAEKYNPSTIFRTYGASWDRIAEQTIEVYRKAHGAKSIAHRAKSREHGE